MSEVYKVPSQGVRHMLSDRSRGLFIIIVIIVTLPADGYGVRLWAELCPLQNTCVLTPGP